MSRVYVNRELQHVAADDPAVAWEFDADDPRIAHLKESSAPTPTVSEAPPKPAKSAKK